MCETLGREIIVTSSHTVSTSFLKSIKNTVHIYMMSKAALGKKNKLIEAYGSRGFKILTKMDSVRQGFQEKMS